MNASEFDQRFDNGEDISEFMDYSSATRPNQELDAVNLRTLALAAAVSSAFSANAPDLPPGPDLPEQAALPDPFTMLDGTRISTPEEWREKRRPELVQLVQHYMYGFAPESKALFRVEAPEAEAFGGTARVKQIEIRIEGLPDDAPRIHLALIVPNTPGPHPVMLGINRVGNHATCAIDAIIESEDAYYPAASEKDGANERGGRADFWCVEYILSRGYAFATFFESDVDPDLNDFTDGIQAWYPELPQPKEAQWGTIRAWAWGFHRCVDYLVTDPDIDAGKIGVIGHSRRGKTALLAAALDERIALAVPHQSGTGGCALSRDNDQETVERINRVFPHWFNGNFKQFNDNEARIPFDQHLMIALVAPRALLDTEGAQDHWANYDASRRALEAADPVWKFLGAPGITGESRIEDNAAINPGSVGNLLQLRLDTKHTLNRDYWEGILNFADVVYGR